MIPEYSEQELNDMNSDEKVSLLDTIQSLEKRIEKLEKEVEALNYHKHHDGMIFFTIQGK